MLPPRLPCAVLLLAACQAAPLDAPAATPAVEQRARTAPSPSTSEASAAAGFRAELRGAPYARATSATLAVLAPRAVEGAEADARARRAFLALDESEQRDLLEWFTVECEKLGTFQYGLLSYVLDAEERPAADWPELGALTWFDPTVHGPGQPIPRVPLAADSPEVVAVRNQILHAPGTRRADSGWMVDYAERTLVRLPHQDDPRRVFENALLGLGPGWDLAEALVELALDDGSLQAGFRAFAHAYTDRWGGVYPGVTLYDAHASRVQIEMPDVDALGIVHTLADDWTTWTSPVPSEQHPALYARLAEFFLPLLHHRGLRTNLARTYLSGAAELRDGYRFNLDNLHALWESVSSDPATLRAKLPDESGWRDFLQGWDDLLHAEPERFLRGTTRHAALDRDAQAVRATMLRLLDEYGAIARIETLPPYDAP